MGIRCRPNEKHVVVEVNDSGIGIEPEALSRIFNAFEQAERSITQQFGGLGLGLAISKALVEMHGGQIEAHSEGRGKGATFRVRLPLTAPAGQPEVPAPAAAPQRAVRPLHILLVEDHGVTAKMMRMVLTADGHTVETAGDIATALELAGQHAFRPAAQRSRTARRQRPRPDAATAAARAHVSRHRAERLWAGGGHSAEP